MNSLLYLILYSTLSKFLFLLAGIIIMSLTNFNLTVIEGLGRIGKVVWITSLISSLALIFVTLHNLIIKQDENVMNKVGLIIGILLSLGPVLEYTLGKKLNYGYTYILGILFGIYLLAKGYELRHSLKTDDKILSVICFFMAFVCFVCPVNCELGYNYEPALGGKGIDIKLHTTTTIPYPFVLRDKALFPVKR
jgi:hypothetical protein